MKTKKVLIGLELIGGLAGWCWIAACMAAIYFLVRAVFYSGSWWRFGLSVLGAWFFYSVSLSYERATRAAMVADQATAQKVGEI